ncbi:MAG: DUF4833 domain-containing protein [Richelia sp. RM2_1_2]|nr:DUF4833 domain-containing protein [Richelia sp. SM1_7_0]NJO64379.1 DUF4833 domain-containing protein [Richelia sp. RM2_1_2]
MLKFTHKQQKRLASVSLIASAIALMLPSLPSYANNLNSIFFISKSDNRNQVHYGVKTNPDCSLKTSQPVKPYWILANGRIEDLETFEVPAFGIANQSVSANKVVIEINSLKARRINKAITIESTRTANKTCQISAYTTINGEKTQLTRVHIDLTRNGLFGLGGTVHSITFYGASRQQENIACRGNCSF